MCNKNRNETSNNESQPKINKRMKDSSGEDTSDEKSISKNNRRKKNRPDSRKVKIEQDSSGEDTSDDQRKSKFGKGTKKENSVKIKIEKDSDLIIDQPLTRTQVKFDNETSTLQFSPSFDLQKNQISTPQHLSGSSTMHNAQIHAIDKKYDIEQKDDSVQNQSKSCLIS